LADAPSWARPAAGGRIQVSEDPPRAGPMGPAEEMFFDVDPAVGRHRHPALTCYHADHIVERRHLAGLAAASLQPPEFWTLSALIERTIRIIYVRSER
jgi:hypothetical protein